MLSSLQNFLSYRKRRSPFRSFWAVLHLDFPLLAGLLLLSGVGLLILYSASGQDLGMVGQQAVKLLLALFLMLMLAQVPPSLYRLWAPWLYSICLFMLVLVLGLGVISKGGQRWLNLGFFRFQPSEIMKLGLPLMLAWYFNGEELPPSFKCLSVAAVLILVPVLLVAKQPDLGTALMIAFGGVSVILLAGIPWWLIISGVSLIAVSFPFLWHLLHDYQKKRILTLFNPERDPLGTGYHIIQSKIAIGSGGLLGKGWMAATSSQLSFLPEHHTDFIFAVAGEELGFIGILLLLCLYFYILWRGLKITTMAQDTFSRLIAGSITLLFFISALVNMGMVCGLLPVVGVPLPLVSYGGTAMVTFFASFGIVMSVHANRKIN
ncbi:MAG: cell shape-determining protein RodA [Gammaproteobacteria bacterium]|nr:cell shape-determining protein RodA [Gammaproteobacteria bacterium]